MDGWRVAAWLALIAIAALATRIVWLGDQAPDADEQLYSLIGERLLHGDLPYVHVWDRKPLGLFALFALAHALGGPDAITYQVMAALFIVAGSWLVFALARKLVDDATACGSALAYAPLMYAYGSLSGQSETFFVPLLAGMALLISGMRESRAWWRGAAAMLLGGLALQLKTTVVPQCLVLGMFSLLYLRSISAWQMVLPAAGFALLGLLPTMAVAALYASQGQFDWFWYATVSSNVERVTAGGARLVAEHLGALAPLAALALGGLYAAWRLNPPRDPAFYRLVCWWTLGVLAGIYLPNKVNLYYFAALVPCVLLLAAPLIDRTSRLNWIPLAVLLGSAVLLLNIPRHSAETRAGRAALTQMVTAIAPHVAPEGPCLLVFDGPTALYRLTHSCLPSRIVYPDHWNNVMERNSLGVDRLAELQRVLANRPGAIVTAVVPVAPQDADTVALVTTAIARDYRHAASHIIRDRTYRVWVRRN
ncbi:MAG: glycosyltransferase family 39 protein [Pseudomonadota bacterium]